MHTHSGMYTPVCNISDHGAFSSSLRAHYAVTAGVTYKITPAAHEEKPRFLLASPRLNYSAALPVAAP
jgi:hypothetical protein